MKDTLHSIQALRAIAAALVVVLHSFVHLEARALIPNVPAIVDAGRSGVDIFFVISGFIMVFISGDNFMKPGAPTDFIIRRVIRVAPTYWLYTLLMAALLYAFPQSFSHGKTFSSEHLLASLSFIPWPNSLGDIKPILNVGWTLNYEIYFYLIFSILLLFSKKYLIPLLSVILGSGIVAGSLIMPASPVYSVVTSSLPIEFLLGCIIAVGYRRHKLSPGLCYALIIMGVALLLITGIYDYETASIPRAVKWGGGSAFLLAGSVFLEKENKLRLPELFTSLGNSSYSLYLTHLFTINAFGKIWSTLIGSMYDIYIVAAIVLSLIVGHVAYIFIERPITSYLNLAYAKRRNAAKSLRQAKLANS